MGTLYVSDLDGTLLHSNEKTSKFTNESYAVENAHEDLKWIATGTIASNDEDGVAKWPSTHFKL